MVVTFAPTDDETWKIEFPTFDVQIGDDSPNILLLWSITLEGNSESSSQNIIRSIEKKLQQLTDRSLAPLNLDELKITQIADDASRRSLSFPVFDTFVHVAVNGIWTPDIDVTEDHNQFEVSKVSPACC
eukprot:GHVU01027777.1.p2 GENE.GHVU01027777.1~~GHVU01027777.1.p2  ORF type:complete len:140 (+),score=16.08 GHVU01027777.1:34-420(+)